MVNSSKTVVLPPKEHAPTAEEISLLESVEVRVTDTGGVMVVGIPIGAGEYAQERARRIVGDGGTYRLARCIANITDK